MWNSPDFNPIAPPSECHSDFIDAIDCSFVNVEVLNPATPQKIEDILVSMRSDLLRIITRWEQSGQGEGGRDAEEEQEEEDSLTNDDDDNQEDDRPRENIGDLSGRPVRALQSRAAFLNGRPSYLLYFWEVADAHQILQSSLQWLTNNAGASDASFAPTTTSISSSTSGSRRRRNDRQRQQAIDSSHQELLQQQTTSLIPLVDSLKELAECQRQLAFDQAEERRHNRDLENLRHQMQTQEKQNERVFRRKAELTDLARKYRKLNAELDPMDARSRHLSDFYNAETRDIDREIQQLDNNGLD
jgi:hypothetical protein